MLCSWRTKYFYKYWTNISCKEVNALIGVLAHEVGHIWRASRTVNSMKRAQETVTIATIITAGLMAASKVAGLDTPAGLAKLLHLALV